MATLSASSRPKEWNAWAGTKDNARSILAEMDKAIARSRDDDRATLMAAHGLRINAAEQRFQETMTRAPSFLSTGLNPEGSPGYEIEREYFQQESRRREDNFKERNEYLQSLKSAAEEELRSFEMRRALGLTIIEKDSSESKYFGTPDDLVEHLDPRSLRSFTLEAPASSYSTDQSIKISTAYGQKLKLDVTSNSRSWTSATFDSITREVEKSVPAWSWLRSTGRATAFWTVVFLTAVLIGSANWIFSNGLSFLALFAAGAWILLFLGKLTSDWGGALIPVFDIVTDGKQPRGKTAMTMFVSAAFQLVAGIIVNVITRV